MVIKSTTAHLFHIGDSRIYRARRQHAGATDQRPPRRHLVAAELSRPRARRQSADRDRLPDAARSSRATSSCWRPTASTSMSAPAVIAKAVQRRRRRSRPRPRRRSSTRPIERGSEDNLTVQIVRVDEVPDGDAGEVFAQPHELPLPPLLEARAVFDGYRIVRELHGSSRSHIYLAVDIETDAVVTIKIPSIDLRDDPAYLKRFMMEEWVARRIDSPHVLKPCLPQRKRNFLYVVDRIHRRPDADAMDDRQSEARAWKPCAASSSRSPRACAPSTARRCCTRTCGPTTS